MQSSVYISHWDSLLLLDWALTKANLWEKWQFSDNFFGLFIKIFGLPKPTVMTFIRKMEALIQESHCRGFCKSQFKCLMPLSSSGQMALGHQCYMSCVHPVSIRCCLYSLVREKTGKYSLVREKWDNEAVTLQTSTDVTRVPFFSILQEQTTLSNCLYSEAVLPTHCIMSVLLNSPCLMGNRLR